MSQYRLMRHLAAVATLGAFATVGCFVVDDKKSDDEGNAGSAGEESGGSGGANTGGSRTGGASSGGSSTGGSSTGGASTGGSSTGGGPPNGGASTGGSSTGGGPPTGGTGGSGTGAVLKFCNELFRTDPNGTQTAATLTLVFAGVSVDALSDTCTPVVPNACVPIPTGSNPTVRLLDGTTEILSGSFDTLTVAAGDEILVDATTDDSAMPMPTLLSDTFENIFGTSCASTDPFTAPPMQADSAPFSEPGRDLRSKLASSISLETRGTLPAFRLRSK